MTADQLLHFKRRQTLRGTVPMSPELFAESEAAGLVVGTFDNASKLHYATLTPAGEQAAAKCSRDPNTNEAIDTR